MKLLTALGTPFTVKSGGHTAFPGGSSIREGITIDLSSLNVITVSHDRSSVSIGSGLRWINVSEALDPLGLAVVGGRSANVGVSGLILGGGISFLSGRRGWACDNVKNFQIVLASGEIVSANPVSHKDLYWALRGGGGSSFGIVTRFDLDVYEQGNIWGKLTTWPSSETHGVLVTFMSIAREVLDKDPDAHLFFLLGRFNPAAPPMPATFAYHLNYLSPPNDLFDTFEGLTRLPRQIVNDTVISNVSTHIHGIFSSNGQRQTWWDTTVRDGASSNIFMNKVVTLYTAYQADLWSTGESRDDVISASLVIQPITSTTRVAMQRNGGNALGLELGEFPLYLVSVTVLWSRSTLDCLVEARSKRFIEDVDALARKEGFYHGFKYMNYAGQSQDVFSSYGKDNHRKLREVARKYDPKGQLRKLWKGYFQL